MDADKEGWLVKLSGSRAKTWQKRYFVLQNGSIVYMKKPTNSKIQNTISLADVSSVVVCPSEKYKKNFSFEIVTADRVFVCDAENEEDRSNWVEILEKARLTAAQAIPEDESDDGRVFKEGFLLKEGDNRRAFKRRFFVLRKSRLDYYANKDDAKPRGTISLLRFQLQNQEGMRTLPGLFTVTSNNRVYFLQAASKDEMHDWIEKILEAGCTRFAVSDEEMARSLSLEDFDLLTVLGRGTYGKVVQARHKTSGQIFAIKIIKKSSLKKQIEAVHTQSETAVLRMLSHPFIVGMKSSFQTQDRLFLVMEYVAGGDLFTFMKGRKLNAKLARFFIAELVLALSYLHDNSIVFRDLKTENILIDSTGHVCLTDFGLAKDNMTAEDRTSTICGTADTMAPEVVKGLPYGPEVDWWGVGCLLYEMLTGIPPFYSETSEKETFDNILKGTPDYPPYLPSDAQCLIEQLLTVDASQRLGSGTNGANAIKEHIFFAEVDWRALELREIAPPLGFKPKLDSELDVRHFDAEFTCQDPLDSDDEDQGNTNLDTHFEGFTYVDRSLLDS